MIEAPVTQIQSAVTAAVSESSISAAVTTTAPSLSVTVDNGRKGDTGADGLPGADGHSPVLTWSGDQIAVDGVVSGPHLTGPQGVQGVQGIQGQPGAQGAPGADGAAGSTGAPGADGHSPVLTWSGDQIAVDGIVSGPHLTGPQGVQGIQGIQGPQGDQGAAGADGADAAQLVYIQQTRPAESGPWAWWVTDAGGNIVNLIINNGV